MTILQSLDRYYDRMAARGEAEAPGYSREKIGFAIVLSPEGKPAARLDLRQQAGRKLLPRLMEVPAAVKRTAGILPNLLWDKSAYVLGRTAGEGRRTAEEHAAFRKLHLDLLADTKDPGLLALRRFLEAWQSEHFDAPPFEAEMLDANLVFALEGEHRYLHERVAARALVAARAGGEGKRAFCLVSGVEAPITRLHPTIKGVEGAQSSGAALVSFNLEAFSSYGQEQGANAPTSQVIAFRYGAALNRMLDRGSRNRLPRPIGDTTVVFWADASGVGEVAAEAAESAFDTLFNPPAPEGDTARDGEEAAKLRALLAALHEGRPLRDADPKLAEGVRFHILGLAPNAARLSVRFWLSDDFAIFARRLADHYAALTIEPPPWRALPPSVNRLLVKTVALQEKFDNIPPLLAGEVTRAILAGTPYPRSLLAAAIMRLRAGDDAGTGWHAAAIRAVLASHHRKEPPPVSLDRENASPAYQLGRLFAMAEIAQRVSLGTVNATIRDRYFGAASATPASVFPLLLRGVQNHLGRLRKEGKGGWIEKEIDQIFAQLPPSLPRSLALEKQGEFAIGYYHQRSARIGSRSAVQTADEDESKKGHTDE
ncbi:type I-C CRISPR-associated protein Cas8c/Csd1 [Roseomonas sp. OT10]|uniref:type I-C CRISPR-associated protein Cas8c/Csd1 n=1 Tax=Roseomonas cutis TaxID=2897332 RepID=UPI001E36CAAC|nr:type I-C CRISPR-associated protein Cas8c/Csd1 [Roseomonas sp. OT10]UFN47893.1 type I-C CRISPR-associated protein Cas8c/Csd1 [Roseomonas sp. OT10]